MSVSQSAQASGAVVTASRLNNYPQGVLTVGSATANASATSGTTELDVLTASAVTLNASNRRIRLTWHTRAISGTVANDIFTVRIKEGSTVLQESNFVAVVASGGIASGGCDMYVYLDSPSSGSHTYKVSIQRVIGSGTATVQASATAPMQLVVEDCGVSP